MNARTFAGGAAAYFILAVTALSADASRALAQAPAPAPAGTFVPGSRDRPPGIPADRWIPINGALGIVLVHPGPPMLVVPGNALPQPLEGYLAVYHAGRWWRLVTHVGSLMPLASR